MKPIRWLIDPKPQGLDPSRAIDAQSQRLHGLLYVTLAEKWANGASQPFHRKEVLQCIDAYRSQKSSAMRKALHDYRPGDFQSELGQWVGRLFYFTSSRGICISPPDGENPQATGSYAFSTQTTDRWLLSPRFPKLPPLELIWIRDENAKLHALRSGEIDLAMSSLSISKTRWLMEHLSEQWITPLVSGFPLQYIALHTQSGPFADAATRRNLRDAIDRDRILATWMRGFGERRDSYFGGGSVNRPHQKTPDLKGVSLTLRTSPQREMTELAQILRSGWQGAGARVRLEIIENGLLLHAIARGRVPIFLSRWISPPSWTMLKRILHSQGDLNRAHYANPQVDQWIEAGLRTSSSVEQARLASLIQAAWDRDVPYILLWTWKQGLLARRAAFSPQTQDCLSHWNSPGAEWKSVLACLQ